MNPFSKAFCRVFQTVLRIAIPVLPYRKPEIISSVKEIPGVLKKRGITKVLLVTDPGIWQSPLPHPLVSALDNAAIKCYVYHETVPNPTIINVEQARELYLSKGCQALIGFGGGSCIDCAKAVGARLARPRKPIPKMKGILQVILPIPYLIAVPTTAGTGSETTVATVISDETSGHKYPISDFPLIPRTAVLDPEMTRSLPRHLTSTTGMDALTHAIEAYIGRSTTRKTRANALEAVRLIAENIENACRDGNDMTARANMLRAAFLAGEAFSISYVGYCHAVAHSLGGKYHIPHGLANAVLLPYVLEAYGGRIHKKEKELAMAMGLCDSACSEQEAAQRLIAHIRKLNQTMGIPAKLKGIEEADIPDLAKFASREANPLYPVPVLMNAKELERFYYDVMEDEHEKAL